LKKKKDCSSGLPNFLTSPKFHWVNLIWVRGEWRKRFEGGQGDRQLEKDVIYEPK